MTDKSTRETLHREPLGDPIATTLKELRNHTCTLPAEGTLFSPDEAKRWAYALSAYVIEQVHGDAKLKIEQLGDPFRVSSYGGTYPPLGYSSTREVRSVDFSSHRILNALIDVRGVYTDFFARTLADWVIKTREDTNGFDAQVYAALKRVIAASPLEQRTRTILETPVSENILAERFIMRGARTAADVSWDIMQSLPLVFFHTYQRIISPDEYDQLVDSAKPLAFDLVSMHLNSFTDLATYQIPRLFLVGFPSEYFSITETGEGTLGLEFDKEAIAAFSAMRKKKQQVSGTEKRYGCPARDARTKDEHGNMESVVASVFDLYHALARKYIVPNLKNYIDRATTSSQK